MDKLRNFHSLPFSFTNSTRNSRKYFSSWIINSVIKSITNDQKECTKINYENERNWKASWFDFSPSYNRDLYSWVPLHIWFPQGTDSLHLVTFLDITLLTLNTEFLFNDIKTARVICNFQMLFEITIWSFKANCKQNRI